ncbi:hypothetical protein Taro_027575 [Colocasia esculenta]|uniref:NADH-ubiquinone reductase complex 1 MLRQ subunit n=1 Tax=Colocasia esculenta TaxID=4460 RepID=A0A843VMW2_COLES|nr:hypothetical protein [Colocasia esculenta]
MVEVQESIPKEQGIQDQGFVPRRTWRQKVVNAGSANAVLGNKFSPLQKVATPDVEIDEASPIKDDHVLPGPPDHVTPLDPCAIQHVSILQVLLASQGVENDEELLVMNGKTHVVHGLASVRTALPAVVIGGTSKESPVMAPAGEEARLSVSWLPSALPIPFSDPVILPSIAMASSHNRWLRPEAYPLFAAVGLAVGICGFQLIRNICINPEVRVTKERRAAGVLENFAEGERYKEHGLRKFLRKRMRETTSQKNQEP